MRKEILFCTDFRNIAQRALQGIGKTQKSHYIFSQLPVHPVDHFNQNQPAAENSDQLLLG